MSASLRRAALLASLALLAGCSAFRWSGHHKTEDAAPENIDPRLRSGLSPDRSTPPLDFSAPSSTGTARRRPEPVLPEEPALRARETLYYTDLGPSAIDVSDYPAQQKYNYSVYANVCSRCHTLARSANLPVVSRGFWSYYLLKMRSRSWFKDAPIAKEERAAILDFLEYDSAVRKVGRKKEFEALTAELERRFAPILEERLRRLQQSPRPDAYQP